MSYRRVVISDFGGSDVLNVVEDTQLPEPKFGEVRIRIIATSAAFTDVMIRKGKYPNVKEKPPFTLGYDLVGVVDQLGPGASRFQVGQRVADLTVIGAYAEYICLPEERLTLVPDGLDAAEAVSLILSYMTPYQMLHRVAQVRPGQRILVHGAGGAVGTAMLQLGRLMSLTMIGTDVAAKQDLIASLGATPFDCDRPDLSEQLHASAEEGFDAIFDPIGGDSLKRSFSLLKAGGVLVAYGFQNAVLGKGGSIPLDFVRLKLWNWFPNHRSTRFYSIEDCRHQHPDWFKADLHQLFQLLAGGQIKPVIAAKMPLSEVKQAHKKLEQGSIPGKIVLLVA